MAAAPQTTQLALTIRLTQEARKKLIDQAGGRPLEEYASELLEHAAAAPSIDAILAPLRREFGESGTNEEELVDQINQAREEHHAERQKGLTT